MPGMQLYNFSFTLKLKLVIIKCVVAYQPEDKFWSLTYLEICQAVDSIPHADGTSIDINGENSKYPNKLITR